MPPSRDAAAVPSRTAEPEILREGRLVGLLLALQALLLIWNAARSSPTHLEPAFLASGLSHWEFGQFDLYRVNPPLVRMVAAIPVLAVGYNADWTEFSDKPGARPEYAIGERWIRANGERSIRLITWARWICIPFTLAGGYLAYCWARELYGRGAGLVTLSLWSVDPLLVGHGSLITPDVACTTFGIASGYTFWRWLREPTWNRAVLAGVIVGVTQLVKLSWLILFGLFPVLWVVWVVAGWIGGRQEASGRTLDAKVEAAAAGLARAGVASQMVMLAGLMATAGLVLNFGYGFEGTGTRLSEMTFVSRFLSGEEVSGTPGNRFRGTWLANLPVPLPRNFVLGFDTQKRDFEEYSRPSYLRGEWKSSGWWYYYVYGLLVKTPCGTLGLLAAVIGLRLARVFTKRRGDTVTMGAGGRASANGPSFRDELVLAGPALALLLLASSQTSFNHHFRYVLPAYGLFLIFAGQGAIWCQSGHWLSRRIVPWLVACSAVSSLGAYPHPISYFNEFVGGSQHGYRHLLGSSWDWGQDWLHLANWLDRHPEYRFEGDLRQLMTTYPIESILPQLHHQSARSLRTLDSPWVAAVENRVQTQRVPAAEAGEIHRVGVFQIRVSRVRTIQEPAANPLGE